MLSSFWITFPLSYFYLLSYLSFQILYFSLTLGRTPSYDIKGWIGPMRKFPLAHLLNMQRSMEMIGKPFRDPDTGGRLSPVSFLWEKCINFGFFFCLLPSTNPSSFCCGFFKCLLTSHPTYCHLLVHKVEISFVMKAAFLQEACRFPFSAFPFLV